MIPAYFLFFPNTTSALHPGWAFNCKCFGIVYVYVFGIAKGNITSAHAVAVSFTENKEVPVLSVIVATNILAK